MKKLRIFPLLVLAMVCCLCIGAAAADLSRYQLIAYVTDANGQVSSLTDDDPTTAWSKTTSSDVDLTLSLHSSSVGEIWIRSGYAYTQNWYSHYDRPAVIKVTIYYQANRYTESYDTFRYRLTDAYRPNTVNASWNSGYQRLLLPQRYTGVTRIELTIEDTILGYGHTGATISDIIVTTGSHATATPRAYATATPRPHVVTITPTPGPDTGDDDDLVTYITPVPGGYDDDDRGDDDYVDYITPRPTATPYVAVITPRPTATPTSKPIEYPSAGGVVATLTKRVATRSGPGTRFDEPGSFFGEGDQVKVFSKVYDDYNNVYWYQIEFQYKGEWYRAYTSESYLNINPNLIPDEPAIYDPLDTQRVLKKTYVYFGPGEQYKVFTASVLHPDSKCDIYAIEDGWALVEYTDYGSPKEPKPQRRGWVPLDVLYDNN